VKGGAIHATLARRFTIPIRKVPALAHLLSPEEIRARLLFRDDAVLILDKPPGLPVHAGSGGGPTLESSFDALRFELTTRPGLAHRLDRETSGCLVLGRTQASLKRLGRLFADGKVEKLYWAIVEGEPAAEEGRIDLALKPADAARHSWRMKAAPDGQSAITEYCVLGRKAGRTWLALSPKTGRTHQIRVHCAAMGFPVLGDWIYGHAPAARRPPDAALHLHARAIAVPYVWGAPPIRAEAPPPPHMLGPLEALGFTPP
jgi:RluA family pseudouridine synthase